MPTPFGAGPQVCLSLLGTWQGDAGESWHADTSTVLQVGHAQSSAGRTQLQGPRPTATLQR